MKKKGLGDVIKSVTTAIGIEPCEGCDKRKDKLNVLFPFGTPRLLTEDEKQLFFKGNDKDLLKVYNDAFTQDLSIEHFEGGIKSAVKRKLTKLVEYNS